MENTCQMNCHACTLQTGAEAKNTCATLLMPAMFAQLISEVQELRNILEKNTSIIEVLEIKLPKKPKKIEEND